MISVELSVFHLLKKIGPILRYYYCRFHRRTVHYRLIAVLSVIKTKTNILNIDLDIKKKKKKMLSSIGKGVVPQSYC